MSTPQSLIIHQQYNTTEYKNEDKSIPQKFNVTIPLNDIDTPTPVSSHQNRNSNAFLPTFDLETLQGNNKKYCICCCKEGWKQCCKGYKRCPKLTLHFLKPKFSTIFAVISRYISLVDMVLDIRLLYKSAKSSYLFLTVALFLSLIAPYLLQYSCGIKLFTLRRTFERFSGFTSIFVVLYLLPTGVLYFVFLDFYDLLFTVYALFQVLCRRKSLEDLKATESLLAHQLSMSRTNWEGLKRQRGVSQLMFETVPQVAIQGLLLEGIVSGLELTDITKNDLLLSVASAGFSAFAQIVKLAFEANAVQESFFQYSLTCFMARIGWVPFRTKIRKVLENQDIGHNHLCCGWYRKCKRKNKNDKTQTDTDNTDDDLEVNYISDKPLLIDYDIKYEIPLTQCIHRMYNRVEYDFSENTLKDLMATLMLRKEMDDEEYEWGDGKRLEIRFHEALQLLSIAQLVNLLRICSERLIIIRGLNNPNNLNWENALNISRNLKQDTTTLKYSRDLAGRPHLLSLYLSEYRLKEYAKIVYKQPSFKQLAQTPKSPEYSSGGHHGHHAHKHSVRGRSPSVTHHRKQTLHKKKAYDFVKEIKIHLSGSNKVEWRTIAFNACDNPEQIAREWGSKYIKDEETEENRKRIINDVASQIIAADKKEDRIMYILMKLKILFRINRAILAEEEEEILINIVL